MSITDKMISDWRCNYGLESQSPAEALRWWQENNDGMAPAGAVAALGLCLEEIGRLQEENRELQNELASGIHTCGPTCRKTPGCAERADLRAELAAANNELTIERRRNSAYKVLVASLDGQLSYYRGIQVKADEAIKTLDSEREANATLTAELAECRREALAKVGPYYIPATSVSDEEAEKVYAAIWSAARKGEGE